MSRRRAFDLAAGGLTASGSEEICGVVEGHELTFRSGGTAGDGPPDARVVKGDGAVFVASGLVTQAGIKSGPQVSISNSDFLRRVRAAG